MKNLRDVKTVVTAAKHLEGGGFPVRRPFPTSALPLVDPFLLFDHMGPVDWAPGKAIGAPDHPHRGFETVTYLLEGRMRHKDSAGHAGELNPGDVQWMTAGSGVVHSEMPHPEFLKTGGVMNGFQVWVNLPKRDKMTRPHYQEIPAKKIPMATSADGKTTVRVLAGESLGAKAVIETRTPIMYVHATLQPGGTLRQAVPASFNAMVYAITGEGTANGRSFKEGQMAVFGGEGDVEIAAPASAKAPLDVILLGGEPLKEPVARYGPFVMNTEEEIYQAFDDYRAGKLGKIAAD